MYRVNYKIGKHFSKEVNKRPDVNKDYYDRCKLRRISSVTLKNQSAL